MLCLLAKKAKGPDFLSSSPLADLPGLLQIAGRAVDVIGRLLDLHVVVLGRPLEVVERDVARLVALVWFAAGAVQTAQAFLDARGRRHRTWAPQKMC